MSLLIKALEKAEKSHQQEPKTPFALEPLDHSSSQKASTHSMDELSVSTSRNRTTNTTSDQQAAASIFVANQSADQHAKKSMILIGLLVFAAITYLGIWLFSLLDDISQPQIVLSKNTAPTLPVVAEVAATPMVSTTSTISSSATSIHTIKTLPPQPQIQTKIDQPLSMGVNATTLIESKENEIESTIKKSTLSHESSNNTNINNTTDSSRIQEVSQPLSVRKTTAELLSRTSSMEIKKGVSTLSRANTMLLTAYQAFKVGDDAMAQKHYLQVLHEDAMNVDALLGMAVIADKQGRSSDAVAWYSKVLEAEPQNVIAQTALTNSNSQASFEDTEAKLKRLLEKQPQAAHLYADLGRLYASVNQWSLAQQAYFQAHHLDAKNADHVFNLAVTLDQLGKTDLALPFYQQALALISQFGQTNIDKLQLEIRIQHLSSALQRQ